MLIVTEDVQSRSTNGRPGPDGWLVYEPAKSERLEDDLVQRGLFWTKEDAGLFAAAPAMLEALKVAELALCHHDSETHARAIIRAAIHKAEGAQQTTQSRTR